MVMVYAAGATLLNALWVAINLFGLPGNWLIVATAVGVWWLTDGAIFHYGVLIALATLALLGEVLEFVLGAAGAAKSGGTRRGALGAILGAVAGGIAGTFLIPIPILGSILGACLGAFAGAMALEMSTGKSVLHSAHIGRGAAVGRFWGTVAKLCVGGAMWLTAAVAAFWPS